MNQSIKSRIAPTPSGYLHIGNAYNFLVTYREVVHKRDGELALRIDDSDSPRVKDEYIQDIFDSLNWLEIPYTSGPKNIEEFKSKFSQTLKKKQYFIFLEDVPDTYICECSRSFLKENHCPCLESDLVFKPGENSIKLKVHSPQLKEEMGDFILWRKDDLPAYQLVSLVEDIGHGTNLVVRGEDLLQSTKAQFYLAEQVKDKVFTKAHFLHHPLVKFNNEKISKSQGDSDQSLFHLRNEGKTRDDLLKIFGFSSWEEFLES